MQKLKLVTFLAFMLTCGIGAAAQELAVKSFAENLTDMDARVNHPVKDQNNKTCAIIKVENSNMGFSFDVGTLGVTKVEQHTGEIWVYVPEGVKKITIAHQQLGILRDWPIPIPVREATVYVLKLISGRVETTVKTPTIQTGFLIINSVPEGADVFINGDWAGTTPFRQKYQIGERLEYRIVKGKYHDDVGVASIDKSKNEYFSTMSPAYGSIRVTSEPAGARVFIDDSSESAGITPCTIEEVASGTHRLTLRKEMYGLSATPAIVNDGIRAEIFVKLIPNFAEISVESLPGAQILVNGESKGEADGSGSWRGTLTEGLYDVEARLAGHRTASEQVKITKGIARSVVVKPSPVYGSVSIDSDPMGATIIIDGKNCGTTPDVISSILIGDHSLRLVKDGRSDYSVTFTVAEDKETTIAATLDEYSPQKYYELGIACYNEKKYEEALKWFMKSAEQGNAYGQNSLGYMYQYGLGVQQDYNEAVKWYRKSAEQGNALGQNGLGYMYQNSLGVQQDYDEAVKWYKLSAEQGNSAGQNNLGDMYKYGYGVEKDYAEAVKWYKKAAEQGNSNGQCNLGYMYQYGLGVQQDYNEAVKWYRKSAEQGNALGQNNLGYMYDCGYGVKKNRAEAIKWYKKAAEQGNKAAKINLKGFGKY